MTHSEFEYGRALRVNTRMRRHLASLMQANGLKPTGRLVFVFGRWMGAFRPLFSEAEEGLLAAEEDAVVGQGKARAVTAHG